MARICLTFRWPAETDRWLPGDRWIRPAIRRIIRGRHRPGGVDKVFLNLRLGLDRLGIPYEVNLPHGKLRRDDLVGVLGRGRECLDGYERAEPLVAGIGLMTHPSEWPTLCADYPVACYLQHSEWAAAVYRPFYGDKVGIWPVGIDTETWRPAQAPRNKPIDFLIYDKIRWEHPKYAAHLLDPLTELLRRNHKTFITLRYGEYEPAQFLRALHDCRAAIFLSEHESQGIACQEAMAAGVPILAWDQGFCLDPARFAWGDPDIPATSVPYFDSRCGDRFRDFTDFAQKMPPFLENLRAGKYAPRDFILENLTVEKCSAHFVTLLQDKLSGT